MRSLLLLVPILGAVGLACGAPSELDEGDALLEETTSALQNPSVCARLDRDVRAASNGALPRAVHQLQVHRCPHATACTNLLARLRDRDSRQVEDGLRVLECLGPIGGETTEPLPLPQPIVVDGEPPPPVLPYLMLTAGGALMGSYGSLPDLTWFDIPARDGLGLPAANWTALARLSSGPIGQGQLVAGSNTAGAWFSADGGYRWHNGSGAGSGLEATSRNVDALLTAITPSATVDVLVFVIGAANGGVYLSGSGGEFWTQINQGWQHDSTGVRYTTFAKTSCNGCPVQYYSGTYGSGVYTRTIPVNVPPHVTGACFGSTTCACTSGPHAGPASGNQQFKLCGSGFLALPSVAFGGPGARTWATGCANAGSSVITCAYTPAHAPGSVQVSVLNTDTRMGALEASYTFE